LSNAVVVADVNSVSVNMTGEHSRLEELNSSGSVEGNDAAETTGAGL
jgi:hypothetical protein